METESICPCAQAEGSIGKNGHPPGRGGGIYNPDNARLDDLLGHLPGKLAKYKEHARFFLSVVYGKMLTPELDEDGFARLKAAILKKYIPNRVFPALKDYLWNAGVLETAGYSANVKSTGYRILPAFNGPPRRIVLIRPDLRRKLAAWKDKLATEPDVEGMAGVIEPLRPILAHMRPDLDRLTLDRTPEEAWRALEGLPDGPDRGHVLYVCQAIAHGDHDGLKVDDFGFRAHSIVTRTSKHIRPFLRLRGRPVEEVDVVNSQPLILAIVFLHPQVIDGCTTYIAARHNGEGADGVSLSGASSLLQRLLADCSAEAVDFRDLCEQGLLYDFLQNSSGLPTRDKAKHHAFRDIMFGRPQVRGRVTNAFARRWPGLFNAVRSLKYQCGYKSLSMILQRLESKLMIEEVCGQLVSRHPDIPFLTIHDSLLVPPEATAVAQAFIEAGFQRFGVQARVRAKIHRTVGGGQEKEKQKKACLSLERHTSHV